MKNSVILKEANPLIRTFPTWIISTSMKSILTLIWKKRNLWYLPVLYCQQKEARKHARKAAKNAPPGPEAEQPPEEPGFEPPATGGDSESPA